VVKNVSDTEVVGFTETQGQIHKRSLAILGQLANSQNIYDKDLS